MLHLPTERPLSHDYRDLICLFHDCFYLKYNTRLIKGGEEPLYVPANEAQPYNALFFAHGFFSSALHETAHWLIAGETRRKQVDFGYWYVPDGRNAEQQSLFQQVEVKPQALEWILATACAYPFRVSLDNLSGRDVEEELAVFKKAIYQQVVHYCQQGLGERAVVFRRALCHFYQQPEELSVDQFNLEPTISVND